MSAATSTRTVATLHADLRHRADALRACADWHINRGHRAGMIHAADQLGAAAHRLEANPACIDEALAILAACDRLVERTDH